ncbi:MAG: tetratricopeptide repeat protein, partial [Dinghuibacter sp.]|nr:tetratricopeptide repeat protein [Dinghuibacter sp.]
MNQTESGATLALVWENLAIPFKIETDLVNIQLAIFRRELTGEKSFNPGWQSWDQAAQYCLQKNTNLEEALRWAETASGSNFPGEANFTTLSTKAGILKALNRNEEAEQAMKAALPMGKMTEIHGYARQLLNQKKINEAVEAFKLNYSKFPNQFTTNVGMARAHSALGEYKKALDFAKKALAQAPDPGNKGNVENMIKNLEAGKNIN